MKTKIISIIILGIFSFSFKYDKPAYVLYNHEGKAIKYESMMKDLNNADMVFFGELHTDPISHWLELEITKDLYAEKKDKLVIGAEMFEADNQVIIDEYLNNFFDDKKFEADVRLWNNYKTDYKPLVEFAKENGIYFVASNIPRRYASVVYKLGLEALDSLSKEAKKFIAPLPITYDPEVACYKNMLSYLSTDDTSKKAMGVHTMKQSHDTTASAKHVGMHSIHTTTDTAIAKKMPGKHGTMKMDPHITDNLPKAQAVKDATMAHFILKNWKKGKLLIHYNGAYHSENHEGILWYLYQANKSLNIKTIAVVTQDEVTQLMDENKNKADYIICVPELMTKTNR